MLNIFLRLRRSSIKVKILGLALFLADISIIAQGLSFDKLDEATKEEPKGDEKPLNSTAEKPLEDNKKAPNLNTILSESELVDATLNALKEKIAEQEIELNALKTKLDNEEELSKNVFDSNAYLELSIINTALPLEYRLESTKILIDKKTKAIGKSKFRGLPKDKNIFFGPVAQGCHEITVEAVYTRLKNHLLDQFKLNRTEKIKKTLYINAVPGYRIRVEIEGFEKQNTLVPIYKGPDLRFNKSVNPNFLKDAALVSNDEILKQGRLLLNYVIEDASNHRLLEKNISIDGLPILTKAILDNKNDNGLLFDAPLSFGKHTLNVTLVFAEKKWISGGPVYNFRLKFNRDFYVLSGQTTVVNLTGMPKGGIKSTPQESRYARVKSEIVSKENMDFFPMSSCEEIKKPKETAPALETKENEEKEPQEEPRNETPADIIEEKKEENKENPPELPTQKEQGE